MKNFLIHTLLSKALGMGKAGLCLLALSTGASIYGTTALYRVATYATTHVTTAAPEGASVKTTLTQYNAGTREGLIGVTGDVPVDNPADNVFHVKVKETLQHTDKVYLVYELSGVEDHTAVSRSVNDQLAVGGYLVKKRKGWAKQREALHASWLRQGDNVIRFTLPAGADHSYRVRNLSLQVEKTPAGVGAGQREVVINQPLVQAYYKDQAYLKGFVKGEGSGKAQITVDGKKVSVFKGEFETLVQRPKGAQQWTVAVQALYADGQSMSKEVSFSVPSSADHRYDYQKIGHTTQKAFTATQNHSIALTGAGLTATKGALAKQAVISITALREVDLPALDGGMVNVTKYSSGFRFLPHKTKFLKEVNLRLAYDENKIPEGFTEKDIKTYFFDEQSHHWIALPTDTVLAASGEVLSRTAHFTDMINAIIKVPETPEVGAYNSTSIKGIKAANPTTAVNLIAPPQANSTGNASLGYSLSLPDGRNGIEPQLSISYNSGGGNDWLGMGWNVQLPAVSIDTRWGVPRYDASKETETYSLNGQQLSPVAHREALKDRSTEKRFYPRVESAFNKIIRHGSSPTNYWWEVTDKSGTKYFYGGRPLAGLDKDAVLRTNEAADGGNIAYWGLSEVRDLDGNFVRYHYTKVEDRGVAGGVVPGYQLYVDKITYTGHGTTEGLYSVHFIRDRQLSNWTKRKDVTIAANLGFKQVTADLLKKVEVRFDGDPIRHYELSYRQGEFHKTLLDSISEFDAKGKLFNTHAFDYYNDVRKGESLVLFAGKQATWQVPGGSVAGAFAPFKEGFGGRASLLSGTRSTDFNVGVGVGVGFDLKVFLKTNSVVGNFGFTNATSEGMVTMLDLNGDGLPDKVYVDTKGRIQYCPNQSGPRGEEKFGEPQQIIVPGVDNFHKEKSRTLSQGVEASFGAEIGGGTSASATVAVGTSTTTSVTSVYFSEVNGDGLPDLVSKGKVFFNRINSATGVPMFLDTSDGTPSPIVSGSGANQNLLSINSQEKEQSIDQYPLHDMVRLWVAPFDGRVKVTAPVTLLAPAAGTEDPKADGVQVAVQLENTPLWGARIGAGDYQPYQPQNVSNLAVRKGDRLYFRLQSVENGVQDSVRWQPVIEYLDKDLSRTDADGKKLYRYAITEDYLLTVDQQIGIPTKGTVRVEGRFQKPLTSDTVQVVITRTRDDKETVVLAKVYPFKQVVDEQIIADFQVDSADVLKFRVLSATNVAWSALSWQPHLYYTALPDPEAKVRDEEGKPLMDFYPVPGYSLFSAMIRPAAPYKVADQTTTLQVTPQLNFAPSLFKPVNGQIVFSVKKRHEPLLVDTLLVTNGQVSAAAYAIKVAEGDTLYLDYYAADSALAVKLTQAEATLKNGDNEYIAEAGIYFRRKDTKFGPLYRQWGHFSYNGNRLRADQPINQNELVISKTLTDAKKDDYEKISDTTALQGANVYKPAAEKFVMLVPFGRERFWNGYDNLTRLDGTFMQSSRYGTDDVEPITISGGGTGAGAVDKITVSKSKSFTGGIGISFPAATAGGTLGKTLGDSKVMLDFMDMNGDRYPDVVTPGSIQYSLPTGGLSGEMISHKQSGENHQTSTESAGVSLSGSFVLSKAEPYAFNIKNTVVNVGSGKTSAGLNGSFGSGSNETDFTWMDINGDGLPDRVVLGEDKKLRVSLNLGYSFSAPEIWDFDPTVDKNGDKTISISNGQSKSYGGGVGVSIVRGSISAGVSVSKSENEVDYTLQDVNGDGLVDACYREGNQVLARLNLGNGFGELITWGEANALGKSRGTSMGANIGFTAGVPLPTPNPMKIIVNPSTSTNKSVTRDLVKLSDVDGDGYPDFVESNDDNELKVKASTIGRTNLLKSVKRPLGASLVMDYQRQGNTYQMSSSVWTMSRVAMFDGFKGDGPDSLVMSFAYEKGYYNRQEREFCGFSKVITRTHDTGHKDNKIYTKAVEVFNNEDYYTKGLLLTQTLEDGEGKLYTKKENTYELKTVIPGESFFPAVSQIVQQYYEGKTQAGKSTRQRFTYDSYGNMTVIEEDGDLDTQADDLSAQVAYHYITESYMMGTPKSIVVNGGGKTYRKRESTIDQNGNVVQIKQYLESGEVTVHDIEYDIYGNRIKITRPANHKGERLQLEYTYDDKVHSYPVKSSNSYGYNAQTTYDYKFGQALSSKDINQNEVAYELDDVGRVVKVTGPYELKAGAGYTIKFEYHPEATVPWALTKHYDPQNPKNDLETVNFVDGLGRLLQTKKDAAIHQGDQTADKEQMVVSGRITFDGLGRMTHAWYPVTENTGKGEIFNTSTDGQLPSTSTYDVLGRKLKVTLPDGAVTQTEYGLVNDRSGIVQFSTKTIDANGKTSEQFTDVKGRVTSVKQYSSSGDIWTSFVYNPVNDQLEAIDDQGHKTISTYDWLGRRITRLHPDAGLSTYSYDLAGNLTSLQTANLQKTGEAVKYTYQYERLTDIAYPRNQENDVHYTYGEAGASDNRAGRIVLQEDASGAQEFFYGPLGEIVKNVRTIVIPQHDEQTFVTEWQYDTWNRLTSMTYADGEKVSYIYNQGGLLHSMSGEKGGQAYNYVKQLGYDKFEQKVFLAYGNGTKTTYSYEEDRRRLRNLTASTSAKRTFMDNEYTYDKVDNILSLKNSAPVPSPNLMGGSSEYSYEYDDLYRLIGAEGHYRGSNEQHRYQLQMRYNSVGSILEKTQLHQRSSSGASWQEQKKTTYQQLYTYSEEQPHTAVHIGGQTYSYDSNGNQTGWIDDKSGQRRNIFWDEENRVRAIMDNGATFHYIYDASGSRILKGHSSGQAVYADGIRKAGSGGMSNYTVYVNPYLVLRSGGYSKHYYVESQRIVSKLGSGWDNNGKGPLETAKAGESKVDYTAKEQQVSEGIVKNLKFLGQDGQILTAGKSGKIPPGQLNGKGDGGSQEPGGTVESFQYYYHPDHLGSTSYITDAAGEVYQHLEYFAYGETFVEEHSNTNRTPYLFNGKELDDETGLYYYGARYYDPRTSIWQSVDQMAEKFPGLSPYNYGLNNPIKFIDPDGNEVEPSDATRTPTPRNLVGTFLHAAAKIFFDTKPGWSGEISFKIPGLKEGRADLMYRDANGNGHFWEIKPVSYRVGVKHHSAQTQVARYRALAQIKDPDHKYSIGTQGGGPVPIQGTLTLPFTDGIYNYDAKLFIPKGEAHKGIIYYRLTNQRLTPEAQKAIEVAKDAAKVGAVAAVVVGAILLAPETGGGSVVAGSIVIGTILTPPQQQAQPQSVTTQ